MPGYRESQEERLPHPSIEVLGHRTDLAELMRKSDVFAFSSVEEGSALVTYEVRASGCVLLVSDATGALCCDGDNGLIHKLRDVDTLAAHLDQLREDSELLRKLRARSLESRHELSWEAAGRLMVDAYRRSLESKKDRKFTAGEPSGNEIPSAL